MYKKLQNQLKDVNNAIGIANSMIRSGLMRMSFAKKKTPTDKA